MVRALSLLCVLIAAGCNKAGSAGPINENARVPIETMAVARRIVTPTVRVVADVLPWRKVVVAAEAAGRVRDLRVEVGDAVRDRQVLARLDASKSGLSLDLVRAQREQAQTRLDNARRDLQRVRTLARRGVAAQAQLDAADNAAKLAEAQLRAIVAQRKLTGQRVADARIVAPFAGLVAARHTELGGYLVPGRPVVTLVDISRVKVAAGLSLPDAVRIKRGDSCRVRIKVIGNKPIKGHIHTIAAIADPRTRRVTVEVAIDNAASEVKPGMIAEVIFAVGAARSSVLVPLSAVVEQFNVPYAFVVRRHDNNGGSVASKRKLKLGRRHDLLVAVEGLSAGEQLVVVGQESLAEGTPIKVVAAGKPPR